ncbi:MAG: HalOD1 output domain-containing protein [Halorubrum sp.]
MEDEAWNSCHDGAGGDGSRVTREYNRSTTSPSTAVIEAIASIEDTDPLSLSLGGTLTLHDHFDPDALDGLFAHETAGDMSISLTVGEYTVRIERDAVAAERTANTSTQAE